MNQHNAVFASGISVFVAVALLAGPGISHAEKFPFRVGFDEVPGIDEIESGDLASAIEILEAQVNDLEAPAPGNILATLCGAYVLNASFRKADEICDKAVAVAPSELAYNNRGVLRVQSGDLAGARQDFDRARPERMDEHLEYLRTRDIGLIADGNFGMLEELNARKAQIGVNASFAVSSAAIENIMH